MSKYYKIRIENPEKFKEYEEIGSFDFNFYKFPYLGYKHAIAWFLSNKDLTTINHMISDKAYVLLNLNSEDNLYSCLCKNIILHDVRFKLEEV